MLIVDESREIGLFATEVFHLNQKYAIIVENGLIR